MAGLEGDHSLQVGIALHLVVLNFTPCFLNGS